ncbi:hypothetical protein JCM10213v2_006301 [Rhodosporidiobolus nylandii]
MDSTASQNTCMVCSKPSTMRCSGCRPAHAFFCSREHQELIWPIHKSLCGAPSEACYAPPLDEWEQLKMISTFGERVFFCSFPPSGTRSVVCSAYTQEETFRREELWHGDWAAPLGEKDRLYTTLPSSALRAWYSLSAFHCTLYNFMTDIYCNSQPGVPYGSFDVFRDVKGAGALYRQYLVFHFLAAAATKPSPSAHLTGEVVVASRRALNPLVEAATFAPNPGKQYGIAMPNFESQAAAEHAVELLKKDAPFAVRMALEKLGALELMEDETDSEVEDDDGSRGSDSESK